MAITAEISSKLNKFNITEERYLANLESLKAIGFTDIQANRIVIRAKSEVIVKVLLARYSDLAPKFDNKQIARIASRPNGDKCLEAAREHHAKLSEEGFGVAQILSIVAHNGSHTTVPKLLENLKRLKELKLSLVQITRIVSHDCCAKNIDAVLKHHDALIDKEYTATQIASMVSNNGGSKNLEAVLKHHDALIAKGYTCPQIVRLFSKPPGRRGVSHQTGPNLGALQECSLPELSDKNLNAPFEEQDARPLPDLYPDILGESLGQTDLLLDLDFFSSLEWPFALHLESCTPAYNSQANNTNSAEALSALNPNISEESLSMAGSALNFNIWNLSKEIIEPYYKPFTPAYSLLQANNNDLPDTFNDELEMRTLGLSFRN